MIRWLQSLCGFPHLEALLAEANKQNALYEAEVTMLRERAATFEQKNEALHQENTRMAQTVADWALIASGRAPMFAHTPLPPEPERQENAFGEPVRRVQGRTYLNERDAAHRRKMAEAVRMAESAEAN